MHETHFLKLLDKMYKYETDPTRTVGATERTRDAGRMDGRRDGRTGGVKPIYPPTTTMFGGYNQHQNNTYVRIHTFRMTLYTLHNEPKNTQSKDDLHTCMTHCLHQKMTSHVIVQCIVWPDNCNRKLVQSANSLDINFIYHDIQDLVIQEWLIHFSVRGFIIHSWTYFQMEFQRIFFFIIWLMIIKCSFLVPKPMLNYHQ